MKLPFCSMKAATQCFQNRAPLRTFFFSIRSNSSIFGSQFEDESAKVEKDDIMRVLHLNVALSADSLVAEGARTLLSNLNTPFKLTEVNLWSKENLIHYNADHARSKMSILKGSANKSDSDLISPVLVAAHNMNLVDMVIISTPMWNYSVPYVLKQYMDIVVQPGINFRDENQSSLDHLRGRRLICFSSAGAFFDDNSSRKDYMNPLISQVFRLMGFDKQEFIFVQGTSSRSRSEALSWTKKEALRVSDIVNTSITESEKSSKIL